MAFEVKPMRTGSRLLALMVLAVLIAGAAPAAAVGVTFSYFVPRNGSFSHPVSPLSIRDIDVPLGRYLGLSGSLSLYGIAGMGITDAAGTPLELEGPAVGPFHSFLGSVTGKIIVPIMIRQVLRGELAGHGGVFGCYNLRPQLVSGTFERYLAATAPGGPYAAVTASIRGDGRWGWGWLFGGTATWYPVSQIGLTLGGLYYLGGADLKLSGSYDAYHAGGGEEAGQLLPVELRGARLDYSGLELLIGVSFQL